MSIVVPGSTMAVIQFSEGSIQGLKVKPVTIYHDARGSLCELFRDDDVMDNHHPVMAYASWTKPGVSRGPHEHRHQADFFVFQGPSDFRLVAWDNRKDSPTYGRRCEYVLGESRPGAVRMPPGVVHAYQNVGTVDGLVFNLPDRLFAGPKRAEPIDEIRHESDPNSPYKL